MKPRVLFPLAATFSTCLFQERLLVSVTPRDLLASSTARVWPWSLQLVSLAIFDFGEIWITLYLLALKLMSHSFSHCSRAWRSSCNCSLSSACRASCHRQRDVCESEHSSMSLMYVRKSKGPRTVPWGTPDNTSSWLDLAPSRTNCCFR